MTTGRVEKAERPTMDLEIALYPVIEGLVPHTLPDKSINALCRQLAHILPLPGRSTDQIQSILESYKSQIPSNPQDSLRWQKLASLLQLLVGIERSDEMIKYLSAFQSVLMNSSPIQLPSQLHAPIGPDTNLSGIETQDKLMSPLRPLSLQAESFENLDRFSDRRSVISSHRGYAFGGGYDLLTLEAISDPYYSKMMSESDILKYIPYTLLATTSDIFPLTWNEIKIPFNVPNADSEMLHLIFEAGLLHQHLKRRVDQNKSSDISPMKKALVLQIDKELRIYTAFVNGLSSPSKLKTLKTVLFETYDHIIKLRFYYNFTNNFNKTPGDYFLSESSALRSHGDVLIKRLSGDIFENLLSLYFEYMVNWLNSGKLEATFGEFFIEEKDHDEDLIPFRLEISRVPGFIPMKVAKEIFLIGKTYIFLGKYCKELQWTNDLCKKYAALYRSLDSKEISADFFNLIHDHYQEVINYSYKIILQNFYYKKVIYALKDILLMGKSDLIDALIRRASEVLTTPSSSLPSYRLTRHLQEAVQHSSLRNMLNRADGNYVINGLDARVLDLGHGSIGWDVFTLDYIVDPPLSIVLNVNRAGGKKEYLRMFNFLWRFKKNDYFYNQEWLRSNQLIKSFKKLSQYRPLVRDIVKKLSKISILRSQLNHFNLKLESYCFKSIIEENFQAFEKKLMLSNESHKSKKIPIIKLKSGLPMVDGLMRPKNSFSHGAAGSIFNSDKLEFSLNIDELEKIHNQYLDSMLSHKLIASNPDKKVGYFSGQPYPTSLIALLNELFEFVKHYSAFNDVVHEVLIQLNLHSPQQQLNNLLTRFNSVLLNVVSQYRKFQENAHLFIRDLRSDGDENLVSLSKMLR